MEGLQSPERLYRPEYAGFIEAADVVNRAVIEAEAHELLDARKDLPRIEIMRQEREDNARTALMEALTASGHLSVVEIKGTIEEINAQVLNRLINGWDDFLPPHEKKRRFAELCNELVIQKTHLRIQKGELPPETAVLEISDYPEPLHGTRLGYRDSNKKGMVRSTHLVHHDNGFYTRIIETASRSNSHWSSTFSFLSACGIKSKPGEPDLVALNTPVVYSTEDYVNGVVDIMRRLDSHTGNGALYGDKGERKAKHPPYELLKIESARRERDIECYIENLANLEKQLDEMLDSGVVTRQERDNIFKEEIERILSAICTLQPEYAEDTFGRLSTPIFERAALLAAQGRVVEADQLIQDNNHLKDVITFCGMTISVEKAQEMGLQVNSFGELIEKGKNSWKWKRGVCRVPVCPTRPSKTEVGPCSVCRSCQAKFDKGKDPTKDIVSMLKPRENIKMEKRAA